MSLYGLTDLKKYWSTKKSCTLSCYFQYEKIRLNQLCASNYVEINLRKAVNIFPMYCTFQVSARLDFEFIFDYLQTNQEKKELLLSLNT